MEKENQLEAIIALTQPAITELGYSIYHLEYVTEEGEQYLRYYIEHLNGDDITLADCETVSRGVSDILDGADPIPEAYFLEVSSPGIFRPLFTPGHILRGIGERVEVHLKSEDKSRNQVKGILKAFQDDVLTIETDKGVKTIDYKKVRTLNLDPEV